MNVHLYAVRAQFQRLAHRAQRVFRLMPARAAMAKAEQAL
jgi:hypothetical protein